MLDAKGLMVFYENMLALNNVNILCKENQIVGVFGANSAGKSTLDVHPLRDYGGYQEEGGNGRRRTNHGFKERSSSRE